VGQISAQHTVLSVYSATEARFSALKYNAVVEEDALILKQRLLLQIEGSTNYISVVG
jgi:hypothetical protein